MPIYTCEKCGKIFDHKGTYTRHLEKKFSCIENANYDIYGNVPPPKKGRTQNDTKQHSTPLQIGVVLNPKIASTVPLKKVMPKIENNKKVNLSSSSSLNPVGIITSYDNTKKMSTQKNEKNDNTIKCSYCQIILKNRTTFNRHLKICKLVPLTKADINELEKKIAKKIDVTLPQPTANNIQNISNTINNTNNNTQNIIYVDNRNNCDKSVSINPFGKEHVDFISQDLMKKIILRPETGIIKLIEHVHFNKEQPENHNIHLVNKKEPYVEVFNGEKWEKQDKKIAIQNMITTKKDIMDDYFDEQVEKNIITTFLRHSYETFSEMLDEYIRKSLGEYDDVIKNRVIRKCRRLYREIFKSAELLLINNKKPSSLSVENSEIDNNNKIECPNSDFDDSDCE